MVLVVGCLGGWEACMVSYLHGRSAREYFDLGTDPRVLLKLIWESMNRPSEVDLGVDEWSI